MTGASGYAVVDGSRLYYERVGEGFPVILIHGDLFDSRMWDEQFEPFAERHDVVRYDLRGRGRSDAPAQPYSDLRDLQSLLDELGIDRCAIVGCSAGARLAIDLAVARPATADAVVLVAPELSGHEWKDPGWPMLAAAVDEAVSAGDLNRAMEIELAVWAPLSTDLSVDERIREIAMDNLHVFWIDRTLAERPPSAVPFLAGIGAATLVVVGDQDIAEIYQIADLLVERIPGAQKRVIAGADQMVNMRRPEKFNRLVLDFLAFRM